MTLVLARPDASPAPNPAPPVALDALLDIARGLAVATNAVPTTVDLAESSRVSLRLLVTEAYEAWLLAWGPGSAIEPHDHGDAHGAFVVVAGTMTETRWGGVGTRQRSLRPGDASTVPVGSVHDVAAAGGEPAISIHVYSPPLTEMRFYDDDGRTLIGVEAIDIEAEEPVTACG